MHRLCGGCACALVELISFLLHVNSPDNSTFLLEKTLVRDLKTIHSSTS